MYLFPNNCTSVGQHVIIHFRDLYRLVIITILKIMLTRNSIRC